MKFKRLGVAKNHRPNRPKSSRGFTIIETFFGLAVIGIIIMAVFLAVPTLTRNSRNTQRQDDIGRIANSITSWVSNHRGNTITQADLQKGVVNQTTNLRQFTLTVGTNFTVTPLITGASTSPAVINLTDIKVVTGAECDTIDASAKRPTTENHRSTVLLFAIESAAGPVPKCTVV